MLPELKGPLSRGRGEREARPPRAPPAPLPSFRPGTPTPSLSSPWPITGLLALHPPAQHAFTHRPHSDLPTLPRRPLQSPGDPSPGPGPPQEWPVSGRAQRPAWSCSQPGPGGRRGTACLTALLEPHPNRSLERRIPGFLENSLELDLLVPAHNTPTILQTSDRASETCLAPALELPTQTQNSSLTFGPLYMMFPCLNLQTVASSRKPSQKLHPSPG